MRSWREADNARARWWPLAGRSLLVAGPAGAIASCVARGALNHGARVALAQPTLAEPAQVDGIESFCATIRSEADADQLVDDVLTRLTRLDALIAVIAAGPLEALHEMTLDGWQASVVEPLRDAFWLARRVVDEFLAGSTGGRLVFVVESGETRTDVAWNEVVEEGLGSFARSIAREYGRRAVACNLVLPAWRGSAADPGRGDPLLPLVEGALFLASPAASFINGETLRLGG